MGAKPNGKGAPTRETQGAETGMGKGGPNRGAPTPAAPATVSGERSFNIPLATHPAGKGNDRVDPSARRPALPDETIRRRV
jgi:hypothetical protein